MNKALLWFVAAVLLQALILAGVPARKVIVRATGVKVILKLAPIDPYSLLSGYYMRLNYDISRPINLPGRPGPAYEGGQEYKTVYVVLKEGADGVWTAQSLREQRPALLPPGEVAIKGRYARYATAIEYGIEAFYVPEEKRGEIETALRARTGQCRAEVRVDSRGNAALVRLMAQDRVYEY